VSRPASGWRTALAGSIVAGSVFLAAPGAGTTAATAPALELIDQTFVVPGVSSADALSITIGGSALDASCTEASDRIRIVAYGPVVTREDATDAVADPGAPLDDYTFELCELERLPVGTIQLKVPTAIQAPSDPSAGDVLRLASAGVIPLGVELRRAGDVDASFITFVDRLETGTDASTRVAERMQVAVAMLVDGGPTLQPNGRTAVTDADRGAVRRALDLLDRIGEAPITIGIRPELVEGLSRSPVDGGTLEELKAALANVDLLSLPYVAVDPSAAAASGLEEQFNAQLRRGEDVLGALLEGPQALRLLWMFDEPVTAQGARMLRDAGVRLGALLPPQAFSLAPSDRQFEIDYGDDTLPATPVDQAIAEALAEPGDDPTLTAYHLAAQVLLMRQMALDAGEGFRTPMVDHNMILSTPTGHIGNVETTAKLVQLLGSAPELSLVPASSITSNSITDREGRPYREPPPAADVPSLTALGEELATTQTDVDAVASMLPDDDARRAEWTQVIDVAASAALSGEERSAYLDAVRAGIDEVRGAIVPPRSSRFTLGGRHSTIRFTLENTGPVELKVRVIISSEKLDIDDEDEDRIVVIAPGETREVPVPVEARTNGAFPVDIELVTPDNEDVAITEPIQVTARVNALTGIGQFATGAFLLVLLSWWVQHLRKRRRQRLGQPPPSLSAL
jgi:hypothetical protein